MSRSDRVKAAGAVMCVVCLHLELFSVAGYPLTVAPLILAVVVARSARHLSASSLGLLALLDALPFLNTFFSSEFSVMQFVRTDLLWMLAVAAVTATIVSPVGVIPAWVPYAASRALLVVTGFSLAQYLMAKSGNYSLYNPFGSHQYLYQYNYANQFGLIRAQGFYLEPSFDALVMTCLLVVVAATRQRAIVANIGAAAVGVAVTRSASGLAIIALIAASLVLGAVRAPNGRSRSGYLFGALLVGGTLLTLMSYVQHRVASASVRGSSIDFRFIEPLHVLGFVLRRHVVGEPFGSMQSVMSQFELLNGTTIGSSIDNGVYLLVFYFGWIAIIAGLILVACFFLRSRPRHPLGRFVLLVLFGGMMTNTGGVMLPEFVLLLCTMCWTWRAQPTVAVRAGGLLDSPAVVAA